MKLTTALLWSTGALGSASLLAAGCGTPRRPSDVAVIASGADLESGNPLVAVHPLSRQVHRYVLFVTLARYDSTLAPEPYAARRWEWSADRRTLTFTLIPDLRWHDGRPTTAGDVAFSLLAARDPATGYARASDLAAVDTVIARDDTTATVVFREPQPLFPLVLCELPLVPQHLLGAIPRGELRRAPFNLAPVGNGPYVFRDRVAGQRWRFARNAAFPSSLGGPPALAGLVVAVVDEATTKFAGLASGDLDLAGISPTMASLVRRDPTLRVIEYPVLFATGIVLNTHRPPFDDLQVRRAISLAIDRQRILDAALAGFGIPASGPVSPANPVALPAAAGTDTLLADSLLDAAGWRRGASGTRARGAIPLAFTLLTVGSGDNALEQLVQADLRARGIAMEIRQTEMGAFLTQARAPEKRFDALVTGIPGDLSLAYLSGMFGTAQHGGSLDYAEAHSPELDALLTQGRTAPGADARREAWFGVQRLLAANLPVVWLYHSRGVQGASSRLTGVTMDLRGELVHVARWRARAAPGEGRR